MKMIYFPSSHQITQIQKGEPTLLRNFIIEQKIEVLDFSYKAIDAETAILIMDALHGLNIKCLNMGYNLLGSEGALALAQHLKGSPIQELDLTSNGIGAAVVEVIKALTSTSIKVVQLAYNQVGSQALSAAAPILASCDLKADLSNNRSWI